MKIISKNKDYYDYANAYGYDDTHVYVRKSDDFPLADRKEIFELVNSKFPELFVGSYLDRLTSYESSFPKNKENITHSKII